LADLVQENKALTARIEALEQKEAATPAPASSVPVTKPVSALSDISVSGFAQVSYFSDLNNTSSERIASYLWDNKNNNFTLNKVKLTIASPPAVRSDTDWSAAFRVSLMAGSDSKILNSTNGTTGFDYVREAYVEMNIPIGTGLNIKAGELISLLNWESGDGGAANPNFSQGYQWYYTGNGPSAGVQADYAFTSWLDAKVRVDNGLYAGEIGSAGKKAVMGSIGLTPTKDLWVNFIGFGGNGAGTEDVNGASAIGGYQFTPKLGTGFETDYFSFHNVGSPSGALWSVGGWVWYDFTPKFGVAFRAEYLDAGQGLGLNTNDGISPAPFGDGITSTDVNGNLESYTITLNWRPTPNLKIQPEFRINHTSFTGGFSGKQYEYVIGVGATYSF
jgi:hypothetical protein